MQLVPGSTTPLVQLSGEHFQIQSDGIYHSAPTASATLSRFGVLGTDLGFPIQLEDKIVMFFGDTVGAYRSGGRQVHVHAIRRDGRGGHCPDFGSWNRIGPWLRRIEGLLKTA